MGEKIEDVSSITVSASVLSEMIGVSDRRIRQLADEGIMVRAAKGRYKLKESIINYILTLKIANEDVSNRKDELDFDEVKAKHEIVKMHMSELHLSLMEGTMHKSEDVERVIADMLIAFRSKLLNFPAKNASALAGMYDAGQIQEFLKKEISEALLELRAYNPKEFYNKDYIEVGEEERGQDCI